MRTVFLGTSQFAADVLSRLAASEHRPALAITRPDRPKGRGRKLACPPVADRAREIGIAVYQPQSVNSPEALAAIERTRPQALLVCAFGALIKEPLLSSHPMLNVHPSLLPRWRGAAPIERTIMAGDDRAGVSIMQLTEGLDSGPICLTAQEPVGPQDDYGSLAQRLCVLGGELLVQALDRMGEGEELCFHAQDESLATYAEKIDAADRMLDPARTAVELERVVRALHPHIGARLRRRDDSVLGVRRARALPIPGESERTLAVGKPKGVLVTVEAGSLPAPGEPGEVPAVAEWPRQGELSASGEHLLYGVADGQALELLEVVPPNGRAMDAAAYMRGHAL